MQARSNFRYGKIRSLYFIVLVASGEFDQSFTFPWEIRHESTGRFLSGLEVSTDTLLLPSCTWLYRRINATRVKRKISETSRVADRCGSAYL